MSTPTLIKNSKIKMQNENEKLKVINKGIYFALIAAVISGVAVFVSAFATKVVKEPFVLTTGRNVIVAIWFSAILIGISRWQSLKELSRKQWLQLILIGIIGGSIPFLLFFKGLSLSTATTGAFIQKSLFIWVSIFAVMFLKEKLGPIQIVALLILLIGTYFLSGLKAFVFGKAELLIFVATLFWAIETIIVKTVVENINPLIIGWGRMFFGSIIMLGFLAFNGKLLVYQSLNLTQWLWIILPSILLMAYIIFWFSSLKYASASLVTSILVIAAPITTLLSSIFVTHKYQLWQVIGSVLILLGIIIFIKFIRRLSIKNLLKIRLIRN